MSLMEKILLLPLPGTAIPCYNRYTFSLAGERFFRAIKDEVAFTGRIVRSVTIPMCQRNHSASVA
jgi:hypothetical protein